MPYCRWIEVPGGGKALVRFAGKEPAPCRFCLREGKHVDHTKLCDGRIRVGDVGHTRTCDAPMCEAHAQHIPGQDLDLCPDCVCAGRNCL